jgi:hypothetical protein
VMSPPSLCYRMTDRLRLGAENRYRDQDRQDEDRVALTAARTPAARIKISATIGRRCAGGGPPCRSDRG